MIMPASFRMRLRRFMNKRRGGTYVIRTLYKVKYFWHYTQWKQNQVLSSDCLNESVKNLLESKASYHERAAINYMLKM